jgi:Tfp pilus assembly protein PilP
MARNKKNQFLKRFLTVALALVLVQVGLLIFFRSEKESADFNQTAQEAVDKSSGLNERRQTQARIQMAIVAYKKETGAFPSALSDLKPKFLSVIPNDPDTKTAFTYRVDGTRFFVGEKTGANPNALTNNAQGGAGQGPASAETTPFIYDPSGKRDPFRPFDIAPKEDTRDRTPLEQFDIGQFKLTAVLSGETPSATVELSDGKGFIVRKGMRIGLNSGEIIDIQPNKLVILETKVDFTGQKTQNTIEMLLRSAEKDSQRKK